LAQVRQRSSVKILILPRHSRTMGGNLLIIGFLGLLVPAHAATWALSTQFSKEGCSADSLLLETDYHQDSCDKLDSDSTWQKTTCNATHNIDNWYSDSSCTTLVSPNHKVRYQEISYEKKCHRVKKKNKDAYWRSVSCGHTGPKIVWSFFNATDCAPSKHLYDKIKRADGCSQFLTTKGKFAWDTMLCNAGRADEYQHFDNPNSKTCSDEAVCEGAKHWLAGCQAPKESGIAGSVKIVSCEGTKKKPAGSQTCGVSYAPALDVIVPLAAVLFIVTTGI